MLKEKVIKNIIEQIEDNAARISTYLIDCPYCDHTSLDLCKICDGRKKLHAILVSDDYKTITIYNK